MEGVQQIQIVQIQLEILLVLVIMDILGMGSIV